MSEPNIFDKILSGEVESDKVYSDEEVYAFRDINPQAPVHILVVPRNKDGLSHLHDAEDRHQAILGKLLLTASKVAKQEKLEAGYRIVINDGKEGCQEVPHLHLHILGGKQLTWPPGTSK